jgi:hypothetical protein
MSCTGPCNQGRKPCPTPEACESPIIIDGGMELLGMLAIYLMGVATGTLFTILLF